MPLDIPGTHAKRIHLNNLLIKNRSPFLVFRNYYRLKGVVPVPWNLNFDGVIVFCDDCLGCIAVAAVAGIVSSIVIFPVAQMPVHFSSQDLWVEAACQSLEHPFPPANFSAVSPWKSI